MGLQLTISQINSSPFRVSKCCRSKKTLGKLQRILQARIFGALPICVAATGANYEKTSFFSAHGGARDLIRDFTDERTIFRRRTDDIYAQRLPVIIR